MTCRPGRDRPATVSWTPCWASTRLSAGDIGHWVMHAGGRLVLDAIERALDLPADALEAARTVLRSAGNLSSPTVLFVLDEEHRRNPPRPGDLGIVSAFGAGFAAHAALIEY